MAVSAYPGINGSPSASLTTVESPVTPAGWSDTVTGTESPTASVGEPDVVPVSHPAPSVSDQLSCLVKLPPLRIIIWNDVSAPADTCDGALAVAVNTDRSTKI